MKIIFAECSAIYAGRGNSWLAPATRAILLKSDGSVSIHNEIGNKPLNYMKNAQMTERINKNSEEVLIFDSRRESLAITLHKVLKTVEFDLVIDDPGLTKDGTEAHLQEWLSENTQILGKGIQFHSREFPTGNGPVDLLVLDEKGKPIVVEIKRVAMVSAVDQCRRYIDSFKESETMNNNLDLDCLNVRGMIAAVDIRPKTIEWAKKHNIELVWIPEDWNEK